MFHFPRRYGSFPHAGVATHQRPKGNGRAGYPPTIGRAAADDPGRWRHGRCPGGGEPGREGAAAAGPGAGRGRHRAVPGVAGAGDRVNRSGLGLPASNVLAAHRSPLMSRGVSAAQMATQSARLPSPALAARGAIIRALDNEECSGPAVNTLPQPDAPAAEPVAPNASPRLVRSTERRACPGIWSRNGRIASSAARISRPT